MAASPSKLEKPPLQKRPSGQRLVKKPTLVKKNVQKAVFKRPSAAQKANKANEDESEEGQSSSERNAAVDKGNPAPAEQPLNVGLT